MAKLIPTRFSLKMLLVVVTLLSIWLAYEVHWLRQRGEAIDWIAQREIGNWSTTDPAEVSASDPRTGAKVPDESGPVPLFVRLSGSTQVHYIVLEKAKLSTEDIPMLERLQSLFPEADGIHVQEPGWSHRWPPPDREVFFAGPYVPPAKDPAGP